MQGQDCSVHLVIMNDDEKTKARVASEQAAIPKAVISPPTASVEQGRREDEAMRGMVKLRPMTPCSCATNCGRLFFPTSVSFG